MILDTNRIQPLRWYEDLTEKVTENYYEKQNGSFSNSFINCPSDKLIPFTLNIPTLYTSIYSLKLMCPNGTTVNYDLKTKLKTSTDLRFISFYDLNGNIQHVVQYLNSDGFFGSVVEYLPEVVGYLVLVVKNLALNKTATYRTDLIKIFDKSKISINLANISDLTLNTDYLT